MPRPKGRGTFARDASFAPSWRPHPCRDGVLLDAGAAVSPNIPAVGPISNVYATVSLCGGTPLNASNLNFVAVQVMPNSVLTKVGEGGKVWDLDVRSRRVPNGRERPEVGLTGREASSGRLGVIFGLNPVVVFGNDQLMDTFLPRAAAGDLHVAFGFTEPDAGTDTSRITTRATCDGDDCDQRSPPLRIQPDPIVFDA